MTRVLILEDFQQTREWLAELVGKAFPQCQIDEAATLRQAEKLIGEQDYYLALVDLNLPDGSGIELIKRLAESNKETFIVVATIYDDDKHVFDALKAGANGYLLKEQSAQELISKLQGITRGEPPITATVARKLLRFFQQREQAEKAPATDAKLHNLSRRELEVLQLVAKGYSRKEIAEILNITSNTTAGYIKNAYQKLNISSKTEAVMEASKLGLVNLDSSSLE